MDHRETDHSGPLQDDGCQDGGNAASDRTDPGLFGRNLREQFLSESLSKAHAEHIGAHVRSPDDDEKGQQQRAVETFAMEGDQVGKGQRNRDVEQSRIHIGEQAEIRFVLDIQGGCHDKQDRDDPDADIFVRKSETADGENQQEKDDAGGDGQQPGMEELRPHGDPVKLPQHHSRHDDEQQREQPGAEKQSGQHRAAKDDPGQGSGDGTIHGQPPRFSLPGRLASASGPPI